MAILHVRQIFHLAALCYYRIGAETEVKCCHELLGMNTGKGARVFNMIKSPFSVDVKEQCS